MTTKSIFGALLIATTLSLAADSEMGRAQSTSGAAVGVALNSCPSGREIEYDAQMEKCSLRYRYGNGDWTYYAPQGNFYSCSTKTVRLRECLP